MVVPRVARVERAEELAPVLDRLGLDLGCPVLVLVGGAGGTSEEELLRWDDVLRVAVLPVLDECGAAVVDGGTNSGVMRVIGRARAATGGRFPLVGVAAEGTIADVAVEPNHTHLVLVPGGSWGDESPWLADVAAAIAGAHRSITLVVNGGAITYDDIDRSLAGGRPVVVLAGTGRTADAVSAAVAGQGGGDPRADRIARSPLVRVLDVDDRNAIAGTLAAALGH